MTQKDLSLLSWRFQTQCHMTEALKNGEEMLSMISLTSLSKSVRSLLLQKDPETGTKGTCMLKKLWNEWSNLLVVFTCASESINTNNNRILYKWNSLPANTFSTWTLNNPKSWCTHSLSNMCQKTHIFQLDAINASLQQQSKFRFYRQYHYHNP